MAIYLITDKALQTRQIRLVAFSQAQAIKATERLYKLHPERVTILCHIPLVD